MMERRSGITAIVHFTALLVLYLLVCMHESTPKQAVFSTNEEALFRASLCFRREDLPYSVLLNESTALFS